MKELVAMHGQDHSGPLSVDETTIIRGALDMRQKTVKMCMTPLEKVFMLEKNMKLDQPLLQQVSDIARTVLICCRSNMVGTAVFQSTKIRRTISLDLFW